MNIPASVESGIIVPERCGGDAGADLRALYPPLCRDIHRTGYTEEMDPRENPYTPGAGRKPPLLAGRDRELEEFALLLARLGEGRYERSRLYSGLRGVGKTVLLLELDVLAREAGWATTDLHEVGSQPDFRVTFGRMAAQLLRSMSRRERLRDRAQRALAVVKAFTATVPGGVSLRLDIEPTAGVADSGDPEEDLAELLVVIGEVAREGRIGTLFLLDEMQNLDQLSLAAICMAFHRVSQRDLPVALVGAGLPVLPQRLFEAKPYASRLFAYNQVDRLTESASRAALTGPAERLGVTLEPDAVATVLASTRGYPYFIQEFGRILWNETEASPIRESDVAEVGEQVDASLAGEFFEPHFKLATEAQQRYLMAMADLGAGPYRSAAINDRLGHRSPGGSSKERQALIAKELIWSPRRGEVDFTIARFAEFIRDAHGFERG